MHDLVSKVLDIPKCLGAVQNIDVTLNSGVDDLWKQVRFEETSATSDTYLWPPSGLAPQ